jgi:hypothetical protein
MKAMASLRRGMLRSDGRSFGKYLQLRRSTRREQQSVAVDKWPLALGITVDFFIAPVDVINRSCEGLNSLGNFASFEPFVRTFKTTRVNVGLKAPHPVFSWSTYIPYKLGSVGSRSR